MFFMLWYLVGLIGVIMCVVVDLRKGVDFTVVDLWYSLVLPLFGPLMLLFAISEITQNSRFVIIKGRKK